MFVRRGFCRPRRYRTASRQAGSIERVWAALGTSQWGNVKQPPPHRTVTRHYDEPKLEICDTIRLEEHVVGVVVLARYTRSGDPRHDVHYIVELRRGAEEHR